MNGRKEIIAFTLDNKTFNDSLHVIIDIVIYNLRESQNEETIFAVNEFVVLAVNNSGEITIDKIMELFRTEVLNIKHYEVKTITSILYMVHSTVLRYAGDVPVEFINMFCKSADVKSLIYSNHPTISKILIKVYQKILSTKNVEALQEIYKYITEDSQKIIQMLINKTDSAELTIKQGEYLLNFYLTSLSTLVTVTSNIFVMYALQPSLLDWLMNDLCPADMDIWRDHELLQNMILILLETHCRVNHQYIQSSNLFKKTESVKKYEDNNMKAKDFEKILQFLRSILKKKLSNDNFNILLKWISNILMDCEQLLVSIDSNEDILDICMRLCSLETDRSGILIADCLDAFLKHDSLPVEVYSKIREMCLSKMCCVQTDVRDCYTRLFGKIPLNLTLDVKTFNGGEPPVSILQW